MIVSFLQNRTRKIIMIIVTLIDRLHIATIDSDKHLCFRTDDIEIGNGQ